MGKPAECIHHVKIDYESDDGGYCPDCYREEHVECDEKIATLKRELEEARKFAGGRASPQEYLAVKQDRDRLEWENDLLEKDVGYRVAERDKLQQENERLRGRMKIIHTDALDTERIASSLIASLESTGSHREKQVAAELRRIKLHRLLSMSFLGEKP